MRKISIVGKIKADEEAMVGIGTLIIFIAMVLVAAVAAGVLIQTSESISNRASLASREATEHISTGINVIKAYGLADNDVSYLKYVGLVIQKNPGSFDIDLSRMKIAVKTDELMILSLNESLVAHTIGEDVFHSIILSGLSKTTFGVVSIHDRDYSVISNHAMNSGDKVLLIIDIEEVFSGNIPRNGIDIDIIPEVGRITSQTIHFHYSSFGTRTVELYI